MSRQSKYMKFCAHIFYLSFISYLTCRKSAVSIRNLDRFLPDLKHILIWTNLRGVNDDGQKYFIDRSCQYTNCYFTRNRSLFGDTRYFDAIVFNVQDVSKDAYDLPRLRTKNQRYVFAANDSAGNYPVCDPAYDNFFNWTWTYRKDSTIAYKFITVFNSLGDELGSHFRWETQMEPIDFFGKTEFNSKFKAAAIIMDQCESNSKREKLIQKLQAYLAKYNLTVDIFGECGMQCGKKTIEPCYWRLKKNYYFYLAFEDSFDADYVTNVVLHAYKNNVVPIVYGGAKYEAYLPPGSYLNALLLPPEALAKEINDIIKNRRRYYDFFRWRNHYSITSSHILDGCALCEVLNEPKMLAYRMTNKDFRKWWHPMFEKRCDFNTNYRIFTL